MHNVHQLGHNNNSIKFIMAKFNVLMTFKNTLSPVSLSGLSTVRYKTTLNTGSVRRAGVAPPTYLPGVAR